MKPEKKNQKDDQGFAASDKENKTSKQQQTHVYEKPVKKGKKSDEDEDLESEELYEQDLTDESEEDDEEKDLSSKGKAK